MVSLSSGIDQEIKLGQNYKINLNKKLGSGAFGEIYRGGLQIYNDLGINIKTNDEVAIKMEPTKSKHPQLAYESKILKYLQGGVGVPNVYYYCNKGAYNFMVIDLLGPSLEDLFIMCKRKFSLKSVLQIGSQMVLF